jgi:two-component system chemotaxis response regulator CheY
MFENPGASEEVDIREVSAEMGRLLAGQPTRSQAKAASPTPLAGSGVQIHLDADPEVPQPAQGKLKILLAEDDFACRLLLQTFLARYGECHIAVNGREAVNAFAAALQSGQPYDLICMDIMMPEMDGREAVRQVRALEEAQGIHSTFGARIFMTTTVQEIKEVFHCFKELCDAYLMKPIDLGELLKQMKFFRLLP